MLASRVSAETIYFDDFDDRQNIDKGGSYTQTLAGSAPAVRSGTLGGSGSATWTFNVETGGWGQRDYGDNNVATPTSSNYLPFTPQAGFVYTLEADITVNASIGSNWFAIGFVEEPLNWEVSGAFTTADYDAITQQGSVRWQSPNVGVTRHVKYVLDTTAPGWTNTQNIAYVGWFTTAPGGVNLNSQNHVSIDNFKLTAGIANPTVTYQGNGNTAGNVPVDFNNPYPGGAAVTALGNTGGLEKPPFIFDGWNTAADGSGTSYQPGDWFTVYENSTLYAKWRTGLDRVWDNGSGSRNWNSTDVNWSGSAWNNGALDTAVFNNVSDTVSLTQTITAGSLTANFGGVPSGPHNLVLSGNSLSLADMLIWGGYNPSAGNGGVDNVSQANGQRLTLSNATVNVSGNVTVQRGSFMVQGGGVLNAGGLNSENAWSVFLMQDNAVATVADGVDFSPIACAVYLNGGTLHTPFVKVGNASWDSLSGLYLNGTTLVPTQNSGDYLQVFQDGDTGNRAAATIGSGGLILDTAHAVGISTSLNGNGRLTKKGNGTLTLSGANTYEGPTQVLGGELSFASASAVSSLSVMDLTSGAVTNLNFTGNAEVGGLRLDGVSQPAGVYGADTHPAYFTGAGHVVVPASVVNALADAPTDGFSNFLRMKYGFFVHYVWGGNVGTVTVNSDGSAPAGLDDLADRFDAQGFADDLGRMQVEYVIFTAWHADMNCLWPSSVMKRWLNGHASQRDLLGDMITAVKAKGIRVFFYTQPTNGKDMGLSDQIATGWGGPGTAGYPDWNLFERGKWNNFLNELYDELLDRYGDRIDGLWLDETYVNADSYRINDYARLRQTIKRRNPDLLMIQNYYGNLYSCDVGHLEYTNYSGSFNQTSGNWPVQTMPNVLMMASNWVADRPVGAGSVRFSARDMFRYTVLQAGVNTEGGGVTWAAGPYPGGGWQTGVLPAMKQVGDYIQPVRSSICNTVPGKSWTTPANSTINSLANGIVATRSPDDGTEFVHVLTPPATDSITLPAPADGRSYASASLLASGHPVTLVRNADASLTLTLQAGDSWDANDTVIALTPVTVIWNGNSNDAGPGTAAWSESVDNFTGGMPVGTRFRSGDNVDFSMPGAATAVPWASDFAVGDLRFSGKDHLIRPNGASTITLASGRIDVAAGITATFEETGTGGPLRLAGDAGFTKTGGGTLVLDLPSLVSGNSVLTDGLVAVRSGALGVRGNIIFNGGTLRMLPGNQDDYSSRIRHGDAPVRIDTGGNNVVWANPLHASNTGGLVKLGAGTLSLAGGSSASNDQVTVASGGLKLEPATSGTVFVPNPGFEIPAYAPQGWAYVPTGTGWTFSPSGGTTSNNTLWVGTSPEGEQAAFLQNNGTMSAEVAASADGHYRLSFLAANRPGFPATGLVVTLDGVPLGVYQPGHIGLSGEFNRFELPAVRLSAGPHTLTFQAQQNGADSATLIDDIRFTAVETGALPDGASLALTGPGATFDPGAGTVTLDSLGGVAGSVVDLTNTSLAITGNEHAATFAGTLTGSGSLTVSGTLRLVGDAVLDFTGPFSNNGVLDIMTWNGTLPTGFVNNGVVLDRGSVKIDAFEIVGNAFSVTLKAYAGHTYQLQRSETLTGTWQNIGAPRQGDDTVITFTDPAGASQARMFYRVALHP